MAERITSPEMLVVINDEGDEVEIKQTDFWQYEFDAQPSAITIDDYETRQGDKLYGNSN